MMNFNSPEYEDLIRQIGALEKQDTSKNIAGYGENVSLSSKTEAPVLKSKKTKYGSYDARYNKGLLDRKTKDFAESFMRQALMRLGFKPPKMTADEKKAAKANKDRAAQAAKIRAEKEIAERKAQASILATMPGSVGSYITNPQASLR